MPKQYEIHELCSIIPALNTEQFDILKAAIKDRGHLLEPLLLFEDKILDGRGRYQACVELNMDPAVRTYEGDDPLGYIVSSNIHRRELTKMQRACIAVNYLAEEMARAKMRQLSGLVQNQPVGDSPTVGPRLSPRATSPEDDDESKDSTVGPRMAQRNKRAPKSTQIVAAKLSTNKTYVETAKWIQGVAPELFERMLTDSIDNGTAYQLSKFKVLCGEGSDLYPQALAHLDKHPTLKAREVISAVRNGAISEANKDLTFPTGKKYRVLYADPPWYYGAPRPGVGSPADIYPTVPTSDICATKLKDTAGNEFAVEDIMAKNAVMFMWTTSPHLQQSFDVIAAWGFEYKTSFIWHKIGHNIGFYNSVRHEFLLVCTRGACTPDKLVFNEDGTYLKGHLFPSVYPSPHLKAGVYEAEPGQYAKDLKWEPGHCGEEGEDSVYEEMRGEHSKKPEYYYGLIERLYPVGDRLEMYCRKPHPGWDFWGNQAVIQHAANEEKVPAKTKKRGLGK